MFWKKRVKPSRYGYDVVSKKTINLTKIMYEWSNESKAPCMYILDYKGRSIDIYTTKPGSMIGAHGRTKEKYMAQLEPLGWSKIRFFEIDTLNYCWPHTNLVKKGGSN